MPLASHSLSLSMLAAALDDERRKALESVCRLATDEDLRVFLVGGPVRDAILGAPVLDLDFSVEGDAVSLARRLAEQTGSSFSAHSRFGTATVLMGDIRLDLVTARGESYSQPGQLPEVRPSSIADDLARRDFAINAMALPVVKDTARSGSLIDPMGGRADLESGIVRVLHQCSFIDDPTRMFRAVRYEQRFGFAIDNRTLDCMDSVISTGLMGAVSGDRWRHEIERILDEVNPGPMFLRAAQLGLFTSLHPALEKSNVLEALGACRDDSVQPDEWLAALFAPLSIAEGEAVIDRLRLSGRRATLARDTIGLAARERQIGLAAGSRSELFRLLVDFDPVAVAFLARTTRDGMVAGALIAYLEELQFVHSILTGNQLLDIGIPQGPMVGEILSRIRDARLDGIVSSEDEERALARELLARNLEGAAN